MYKVVIKMLSSDEIVEVITYSPVEKVKAVNIENDIKGQLNHSEYYTDLIPVE